MHPPEALFEYAPLAHATKALPHTDAPGALYFPLAHGLHGPPEVLTEFARHRSHDVAPRLLAAHPAAQGVHATAPATGL